MQANSFRMAPVAALSVLLCALPLAAQNVTGSITGIVKDPSGAAIPGARIKATNSGTQLSFEAASDEIGSYTVRNIPVGIYAVTAQAAGFTTHEAGGIRVQVNETVRLDMALPIGTSTEVVIVEATAPAVDTVSPTLKSVVDQKRIEDLPLNGRNPTQLMRLVAGVTTAFGSDVTSGTTYPGTTPVSVNGGRANTTNYVLDGNQNNDHYSNAPSPMPNPDALQEFSVQTNNFSAEFGRQSGGIVNAVTKSGTNKLHGSAFEFVRNNALNAANFFAPIRNGEKVDDGLKRHQFGATLGGPVWLPKLYDGRNKTFFFFSYQGTTERRAPTSASRVVPTAAQRAGDFSALTKALRDPFTGEIYPNNQIPTSQFSPIALGVLEHIPAPAAGNTIFTQTPNNFDDNQFLVRIDHNFGDVNRLTGRYWDSRAETPGLLNPKNYLELVTGKTWKNQNVALNDTHVFTPALTNQITFGFTRTDGRQTPVYPEASIASLGSKMYNHEAPNWELYMTGYFDMNTGDTNQFLRDEYQVGDTVRWTRGKHSLTFGGEYGYGIGDVRNNWRASGQFFFDPSAPFTGDAFADFLLGKFYRITQGIGEYRDTRFHRLSLFVQDSFKVARNFTLDLGARWEPFFPYFDLNDKIAVWQPGAQSARYPNAPAGVLYAGDRGVPRGGYPTVWENLAPRLGFAWDVRGDGKTSLRGGYGIFFDSTNTIGMNGLANQAPFGTVVSVFGDAINSWADPWAGATNPFPASVTPDSNVAFAQYSSQFLLGPDMRNPYVQSWNLTLERQVPAGFVARASYAGSKGTRLTALRELNPAAYAPGATTATTNARRPYAPAMGSSTIIEPLSNSTFHALQLTAERRFAKGFSILANYQFAKSLDDASGNKLTGQTRTNPYDQSFDKGPSDYDKRHVANISGLWEIPYRAGRTPLRLIAGGWSINSIVAFWSGVPLTITSGVDNARTGTGGQRAVQVGDPYFEEDRTRSQIINEWLRKSAFAQNALGTFGTLGRNSFRGPGYATVDISLAKAFPITEQVRATFRFEAFNSLNRVNLAAPSTSLSSGNYMRITSAYEPRILQMAMRLAF
jgi:hypothetical protein